MIKLSRPSLEDLRGFDNESMKSELLKMSHNKCAYCEGKINRLREAEKDHYLAQSTHPHKVADWDNWLPACSRCNGVKGNWDCEKEPIVDPTKDDPREHLSLNNSMFEHRSAIGRRTIICLRFDELEFSKNLLEYSKAIIDKIKRCEELLERYKMERTEENKRSLKANVEGLLRLTKPESEYSAIYATTIIRSPVYHNLKKELKRIKPKLWTLTMANLDESARNISLDLGIEKANVENRMSLVSAQKYLAKFGIKTKKTL